jgi:hypothetical protein
MLLAVCEGAAARVQSGLGISYDFRNYSSIERHTQTFTADRLDFSNQIFLLLGIQPNSFNSISELFPISRDVRGIQSLLFTRMFAPHFNHLCSAVELPFNVARHFKLFVRPELATPRRSFV